MKIWPQAPVKPESAEDPSHPTDSGSNGNEAVGQRRGSSCESAAHRSKDMQEQEQGRGQEGLPPTENEKYGSRLKTHEKKIVDLAQGRSECEAAGMHDPWR